MPGIANLTVEQFQDKINCFRQIYVKHWNDWLQALRTQQNVALTFGKFLDVGKRVGQTRCGVLNKKIITPRHFLKTCFYNLTSTFKRFKILISGNKPR